MKPVQVYATCLLLNCERFENYEKYGSAYHGPKEKTVYYEIKGLASIDIDTMDDFKLVESIMKNNAN